MGCFESMEETRDDISWDSLDSSTLHYCLVYVLITMLCITGFTCRAGMPRGGRWPWVSHAQGSLCCSPRTVRGALVAPDYPSNRVSLRLI